MHGRANIPLETHVRGGAKVHVYGDGVTHDAPQGLATTAVAPVVGLALALAAAATSIQGCAEITILAQYQCECVFLLDFPPKVVMAM